MTRWLTSAVLLTACWASAQSTCPANPAMHLRILTYNTWLQVTPGDSSEAFGMPHVERARLIADKILADDPDIAVLQEVNEEDATWAFVEKLGKRYPSYVRKIDQNNPQNDSGLMLFSKYRFVPTDRARIDRTILGSNEDTCEGWNGNVAITHCNQVIYGSYESNGSDWWMNKGVGLVRVVNECNKREPFNIAFTHTQAKGSVDDDACAYGEDVADLQQQLSTVRRLFEYSLDTSSLLTQPTFFAGDFNLDGNQKGANSVTQRNRPYVLTTTAPWSPGNPTGPQTGCAYTTSPGFNEWQLTFDSKTNGITDDANKSFYACRGNRMQTGCSYQGPLNGTLFVDSWASNTSSQDPGQTSVGATGNSGKPTDPQEGQRLDYVLHNEPKDTSGNRTLCTQWARRGFRTGAGDELSDHLPVTVDFNFPAPRCTPRPRMPGDPALEAGDQADKLGPQRVFFDGGVNPDGGAEVIAFAGLAEGSTPTTSIRFPGSMQWYVLDQAVPIEIKAIGPVAWEIFQASDLSAPIREGVECSPITKQQTCRLTLSKPPYYVRVFGAEGNNPLKEDRSVTGTYEIGFKRLTCSSQAEACRLMPGVPLSAPWPDRQLNPGANTDEMWFEFQTEFASDGSMPEVDFEAVHDFARRNLGSDYVDPLLTSVVNKKALQLNGGSAGGFQSQTPAPVTLPTATPTWKDTGSGTWVRKLVPAASTLPGGKAWPEKYFLIFKRALPHRADKATLTVTLRTSLSYFRPKLLRCDLERTYSGYDDLASGFKYGDVSDAWRQLGAVNGDYETWYRNSRMKEAGTTNPARSNFPWALDRSLVGDGPGKGQSIVAYIYEDVIDGDNYRLCNATEGGQCSPVKTDGDPLATLKRTDRDPASPDENRKYRYTDDGNDPYYDYWLFYRMTHTRPVCRGTTGVLASDCGASATCSTAVNGLGFYDSSPRCVCTSNAGCRSGETCTLSTGLCQ